MIIPQININQMPEQSWRIAAQPLLNINPLSPITTNTTNYTPKSLSSGDTKSPTSSSLLSVKLFDNAAELKILVSHLIMHLSVDWKNKIFKQLDFLLSIENWEEDSSLIQKKSFLTFLRFVIFTTPAKVPSLGVGISGNLLCAWLKDNQQITIEFFDNDKATATFMKSGTRSTEAIAWHGHVVDLKIFIKQIDMTDCIFS
jgi:hypothetical protein